MNTSVWRKRINAARRRREKYEQKWAQFALLHAKAYTIQPGENDDETVTLPNGDIVGLSLVHRNVEQTMAILETPELGVRAKSMDTTLRPEGYGDLHRESIVEQALVNSSRQSGLLTREECSSLAKLDAILFGHGIVYSSWREESFSRVVGVGVKLEENESGEMEAVINDETGEPETEDITEEVPAFSGVQDEHVPVLEFLFESTAKTIAGARWHGREQVVLLEDLKADATYQIPDGVRPSAYRQRDVYGVDAEPEEVGDEEWVKLITVWDKPSKRLLSFLDAPTLEDSRKPGDCDLLLVRDVQWPVNFQHPDDSPFSALVLIPAVDQPFGVSQIEHTRNAATEADKIRTRQANIVRQQKRIGVYNTNYLGPDQWDAMVQSPDMGFAGVRLDEGVKVADILSELPIPSINADLYRQADLAEQTVRNTSGVSDIPMGGAQTATETEAMTAVGNARANRKQRILLDWFAQILSRHKDFLAAFSPPGQSAVVPDESGMPTVMQYGREAFAGRFDIKVLPSGGAFGLSPVQQKTLLEFSAAVMGKFGPQFDAAWFAMMAKKFDIPEANRLSGIIMKSALAAMGVPAQGPGLPRPAPNLNNYTPQQAVRDGINAVNE